MLTIEAITNFVYPDQHEFKWKKTTPDQQVLGKHPHYSIEDIVFVETTEGDLTIKVDNETQIQWEKGFTLKMLNTKTKH